MDWIELTDEQQLEKIREESRQHAVVIFKHSTRCSISAMAKMRLEREQALKQVPFYYLDVLRHRPISNKIAEDFHISHESPQVLVIKNGECIFEESHNGINMQDIDEQVA